MIKGNGCSLWAYHAIIRRLVHYPRYSSSTHPSFGAAMHAIHVLALSLALHRRTSSAFSFTINNTPEQCSNLNISIIGSGQPPYTAVVVPYITAPSGDAREVLVFPFNGVSTSVSCARTYPQNSQFVVVVSNPVGRNGFG